MGSKIDWAAVMDEIETALPYFKSVNVRPTLRTLYYRTYSKGLHPNTKTTYKTYSKQFVKARKTGRFPWDCIADEERTTLGKLEHDRFDDDILEDTERHLNDQLENISLEKMLEESFDYLVDDATVDRWADQAYGVELWIEKKALVATLHAWTKDLKVPVRVSRGYSGWTFLYNCIQEFKETAVDFTHMTILYLGDWDPSGRDIYRFIQETFLYFDIDPDKVTFKWLAVTPEQVEDYKLPPQPQDPETWAKLRRDVRFQKDKAYWMQSCIVEVDALLAYVPEDFRIIVRDAILEYWDHVIYDDFVSKAEDLNNEIQEALSDIKDQAKHRILKQLQQED